MGGPDLTAIGAAFGRAGHVVLDDPPHVLEDTLSITLADGDLLRATQLLGPDGRLLVSRVEWRAPRGSDTNGRKEGTVMRTTKLVGVGVVLWSLWCPPAARSDDVRKAVDAGNRAFVAAFLRGDAHAVAELYTEDAQVIAPGAPVARGRAAIAAAWKKAMDAGVRDVRLETADVESSGDLASETGRVEIVNRDGSVAKDRYVVVWKRMRGEWKLHRDIWNGE